jgi:radical SAM superfamily enzyme YgiQ (UPF0313 family)
MKVVLIVARCECPRQTYREYPLGVGMIATSLRLDGHDVAVFDQAAEDADDQMLAAYLQQAAPEVVGFSLTTPNYPASKRQIQRLRTDRPDVLIVAGGVHATLFPDDLLADGVDVVVRGEGVRAAQALLRRGRDRQRWREIPGLSFRDEQGRPLDTPLPPSSEPDGDFEIIDRGVYNLALYAHHSVLASLGCPYRCAFCCNYSGTVLHRRPAARPCNEVIQEIQHLVDHYAADRLFFVDDVFLLGRPNTLDFCRRLAALSLPIRWVAQVRANGIDAEVAEAMAAAGCERVCLGAESGSEAILRRARKGIVKDDIRVAVRHARGAGMRVKTGWIYGLPGTLAEQYETIPFLRELRPHQVSLHWLVPFPGTDYYREPRKHGIRIGDPKDFGSFCYGDLSGNVTFDYVSHARLMELMERTVEALESEGYVSSDRATPADPYVFCAPSNVVPMRVFRSA